MLLAIKIKRRTEVGRGEERLLCDPVSELQLLLGRREMRKADRIYGKKNNGETKLCVAINSASACR